MLWMGIWIHIIMPLPPKCVGQEVQNSQLKSCITDVFDNLHMLWMGMWIYHHAITTKCIGPRYRKSAEILHHCLTANDTVVQWLRLIVV